MGFLAMAAGVVTALAGTALLITPERIGLLIGLTDDRDARVVGVVDLALAPGLLFARSRRPWLMARAVSNVATAAFVLRRADDVSSRVNAWRFTGVMALATLADAQALRATAGPPNA